MPTDHTIPNCGVYEIWCLVSGKVYVGSSLNVAARLQAHFSRLRRGRHENAHLQRAWDFYGEGAFWGYLVVKCTPAEQFALEQEYLNALPTEFRYNIGTKAGRGDRYSRRGRVNSSEHNQKISAANRGKVAWNKGGLNTWSERAAHTRVMSYTETLVADHLDGRTLCFTHEAAAANHFGYKRKRINESLRRDTRLTTGWKFRWVPKGVGHPNL